ncbi:MAG: type 1 glutamine amidotransferase [Phycisphaerales bacterium]|nr:type 1 glutamine amidotransferase [Phycisphaerales bacterium]
MIGGFNQLKILLLQIRDTPEIAMHEQRGFEQVGGLSSDQIQSVNVVNAPTLPLDLVDGVDAIFIGGSGEYSVTREHPFSEALSRLVIAATERDTPLFGSCWGHQFIAHALGGTVVTDAERAEVGNQDVMSTDAAASDPVFGGCPPAFPVLMGHHDYVQALPPGGLELAYSPICRNQAFRIEGKPVWGTQFHAELTPETLMDRLRTYRQYVPDDDALERMAAQMRPTPDAEKIIPRFLEYVCHTSTDDVKN